MPVEADPRHATGNALVEPLAELEESSRFLGELADRQLDGRSQPDDQGDGHRPAPESPLVAAAVKERLEPHLGIAATDIQGADPLGSVELVRREAEQVDRGGLDVE